MSELSNSRPIAAASLNSICVELFWREATPSHTEETHESTDKCGEYHLTSIWLSTWPDGTDQSVIRYIAAMMEYGKQSHCSRPLGTSGSDRQRYRISMSVSLPCRAEHLHFHMCILDGCIALDLRRQLRQSRWLPFSRSLSDSSSHIAPHPLAWLG